MRLLAAVITVSAAIAVASARQPSSAPALDAALRAFWAADSSGRAEAAVRQIAATGAGFDAVAARLRRGREYGKRPTGRVDLPSRVNGLALDNVVEVPEDYDPARAWPLRVMLHGGVGRAAPARGGAAPRPLANRIPGAGELVLHPRAWSGIEWWTDAQVENVFALIDRVKRDYNVDESRVYVTGISDGGTGVYYLAMRAATPWAACVSLNGQPLVLANPDVGADGQLFAHNLVNCPMRAVNGGRDQLYPAASVAPVMEMLRRGKVPMEFQVYPEAGHDVSWWPQERARFEAFVQAHPRAAHPERVSWEADRADRGNRFRWVAIDRLGDRTLDVSLEDVNRFTMRTGRTVPLFDRSRSSGRVDAVRRGNAFEVRTRGVRAFTLLLSPDVVNFAEPVRVTVNGRTVHEARVAADIATLLQWAARDNDRTMLYGAELKITVP